MGLDEFNDKMDDALGHIGEAVGRAAGGIGWLLSAFAGVVVLCLIAGFGAVLIYFGLVAAGLTGTWFLPMT